VTSTVEKPPHASAARKSLALAIAEKASFIIGDSSHHQIYTLSRARTDYQAKHMRNQRYPI
jgi:hypothetical protein